MFRGDVSDAGSCGMKPSLDETDGRASSLTAQFLGHRQADQAGIPTEARREPADGIGRHVRERLGRCQGRF